MTGDDPLIRALRELIEKWRAAAYEAGRLVRRYENGGDDAGNAFAFLKERRVWATCADDLAALLRRAGSEPPSHDLRALLEQAFEVGHWAWPTLDHPTRVALRQKAVDELLAVRAGSDQPEPQGQKEILDRAWDAVGSQRVKIRNAGAEDHDHYVWNSAIESALFEIEKVRAGLPAPPEPKE